MAWKRISNGRGHRYVDDDGNPVAGVTTILNAGVPKPALVDWSARQTAGYAVDHWTELESLPTSEKIDRLVRARWETTNAAGRRGTEIHRLAHGVVAGVDVDVPDELVGFVDSLVAFLVAFQPSQELAELVVLNRRRHYAGTLDYLAWIAGERWLIDWKTGAKGIYPETALQLAAYANAETYLDELGVEHPLPKIERAGAVWLREDGFDLIPIDRALAPETFRYFLHAQQVADFMASTNGHGREDWIGDAIRPPTDGRTIVELTR